MSHYALSRVAQDCFCLNARSAARTLTQLYEQCLAPAGLTAPQFAILVALDASKGATITQLATMVGLERTTLTRSLGILKRQRLVKIETAEDARRRIVRLTPRGVGRCEQALPLWEEAQAIARESFNYKAAMRAFRDINEKEFTYHE